MEESSWTARRRFWGSIPAQYKADEIATSTVDAFGRIVAADRSTRLTFNAGDAIEQLLVDRSGAIWTGDGEPAWFSAFDSRLESFWLDVYALNVGDRRVWVYPYTDFPLVEIDRDGIRSVRSTPVEGARGIAVAGPTVAFVGRYEDRPAGVAGCGCSSGIRVTGTCWRSDGPIRVMALSRRREREVGRNTRGWGVA